MQNKYKILVSAYACSPGRGSEPGMGWNFVFGLSKYHQVHVITEEVKFKQPIINYLEKNPELSENLKFFFIRKKRNRFLRKIWPPSYYWYYRQWQKQAWQLSKELDLKENFDLIHQLNMVGYREPGYLWRIGKPFVWGPIGGLENSPWRFLPSLGLRGMMFFSLRNIINALQRRLLIRPKMATKRKDSILIAATENNALLIKKHWHKDPIVINEVGHESDIDFPPAERNDTNEPLKIIWSGLHIPRKNLTLLLRSLTKVSFKWECHILGAGEMTSKWQRYSAQCGTDHACKWHGWLDRDKAIEIIKKGHVFCITSISDLTSTVTLEALSFGLPIVCLDHCGFSNVVTDQCGIKIPITTPSQASKDFAIALDRLNSDERYRQKLSAGALRRAKEFSWDKKIGKLNEIYTSLVEK